MYVASARVGWSRRRRRRRGCRPFFLDSKSFVRERDIVWHRSVVFHSLHLCLILGVFAMYVLPYHISCHIIYRWREIGGITTIDSYYGYGGSAPPTTGSLLTNRITSSVYSYSLRFAGLYRRGGCPHPFFTLHLSSSRDFPYLYNIVLVFEYPQISRTFYSKPTNILRLLLPFLRSGCLRSLVFLSNHNE